MTSYRVSFFKDVLSSDGHPFTCLQKVIEIRRVKSADRAVQAAKRQYQELRGIYDWTLHADYFELEVDGKKVDYCPKEAEGRAGRAPLLSTSRERPKRAHQRPRCTADAARPRRRDDRMSYAPALKYKNGDTLGLPAVEPPGMAP
jgi:hypothetical protein